MTTMFFSKPVQWPFRFNGHAAAFAVCAAFVIGIACWGGGRAGWQFEEDYEIFNLHDDLKAGESYASVAARYTVDDHRRIRIYYWVRTLQVKWFGLRIDFFRWSFVLLGVITFYLAYRWSRFWGLSWIESVMTPVLLFGGTPMIIWWRMGTAENLGMFFLFAALIAGCLSAVRAKRKWLWDAVFTAAVCGMTLSKESFLAAAPAAVFLKLWFEADRTGRGWKETAKRNLPVIGLVGAVTAVLIVIIVVWTGTVVGGYVGVEGFMPGRFLGALKGFWDRGSVLLAAGSLLLAAICVTVQRRGAWTDAARILVPGFAVAALLTVSTGVLFQKTGVQGHYQLPGRIAVVLAPFLVLIFLKHRRARVLRAAVLALALVSTVPLVEASLDVSRDFWKRSETVRKLIETVRSNTRPDDPIVVVLDLARQREWSRAMKTYWERLGPRGNLFLYPIIRKNLTPFERQCAFDGWDSPAQMYAGRMVRSGDAVRKAKLIVCFPYNEIWFLASSKDWFTRRDYDTQIIDGFIIYRRKEGMA